ncbi:MAG: hypothetical protein JW395_3225 [Nitrospira sp.]|nr:hypothetical protein [Nitrospira sp.]
MSFNGGLSQTFLFLHAGISSIVLNFRTCVNEAFQDKTAGLAAYLPMEDKVEVKVQRKSKSLHLTCEVKTRHTFSQDAQNGCPARPQRVKRRGVPSGVR